MTEICNDICMEERRKKSSKNPFEQKPHELSNIKRVIGVASGKGGVGKSMVTSLLAAKMQKLGYNCAILDADITGPSIPKAFGVDAKIFANEHGMFPSTTKNGTKIVSVNLMIENDTDPVMWRAPIICGMVKQFWSEVIWQDIDFMFVDLPPGTGDVPLTVYQSLPLEGVIIVSTPQKLVSMIVEKAVKMTTRMQIPILGIVENMSYVKCPDCNKEINIFGETRVEETAKLFGVSITDRMPIDPVLTDYIDAGNIEEYENDILTKIINYLTQTK